MGSTNYFIQITDGGISGISVGGVPSTTTRQEDMAIFTAHNKLYSILITQPKRSVDHGYLTSLGRSEYALTKLAKDELVDAQGNINEDLALAGIPKWKRDWYK